MNNFEQGRESLEQLIKWYASNPELNRNEATTRLHLVDKLMFSCLGWPIEDCITEENHEGNYSDYTFSAPQRLLIVEAKREGTYFELPVGLSKNVLKIETLIKTYADLGKAIKQCASYCLDRGTVYGAVCNGYQIVAFIGSRVDGISPIKGNAIVFESLEYMLSNFKLFWDCLSKSGIQSYRLSAELSDSSDKPLPEKLSQRMSVYPGYKNRNEIQADLQILGGLVITNVAEVKGFEYEFLERCYCRSGQLSQYAAVSKDILKKRYSALFEQSISGPKLSPLINKKGQIADVFHSGISNKPIVLLGDIGVGKTMFIKHFIKIDSEELSDKSIFIYVDFGSSASVETNLNNLIMEEIAAQLLSKYDINIEDAGFVERVYKQDLKLFDSSVMGSLKNIDEASYKSERLRFLIEKIKNKGAHTKAAVEYITVNHHRQIVIFIDNLDQRTLPTQEEVFLIAQSMASSWPAAVFITLRPETFYKSKQEGTLGAYHSKFYTIAPPRLDKVIMKRLDYALDLVHGGKLATLGDISLNLENLFHYLSALHYSFENNDQLIEFGENMCSGNIRIALDFINTFIGSGHVDTVKIINIEKEYTNPSHHYLVPLHEFLRAVLFGDHAHFNPSASQILNMFDICLNDGREHFLMPILLTHISRSDKSLKNDGFIERTELFNYCQKLGYQPIQIENSISRALSKKLIETNTKLFIGNECSDASHYRITTIGGYSVKILINQFPYVDAMVVDTPIVDSEFRLLLNDVDNIHDRLERAAIFCDYLDNHWETIDSNITAFKWNDVSIRIREDINRIRTILASKS